MITRIEVKSDNGLEEVFHIEDHLIDTIIHGKHVVIGDKSYNIVSYGTKLIRIAGTHDNGFSYINRISVSLYVDKP